MNELKKRLAEQAPAVLPDERVKENIRLELGYSTEPSQEAAYAHGGSTAWHRKKKLWIALAAGLLAAAIALGILLPVLLQTGTTGPIIPGGDKFLQIKNTSDFYAYGAASVGSLLSSREDSSTARTQSIGAQTTAQNSAVPRSASILSARSATLSAALSDHALTDQQTEIADTVNG